MSIQPYPQERFLWSNALNPKPLKADALAREQALGQQLEQHLSSRIAQIRRSLFSTSTLDTTSAALYTSESEPPSRLDIEA